MHVLTKVLVAFTAIASVALATLTMAYAVNADRVVQELRSAQAAAEAAKASLDIQTGEFSTQLAALDDMNQSLNDELGDALESQRELQVALSKVEGEKAEAERARAAIVGEISQLSNSARLLAELTSKLTDENDDLRDRYIRQNEELLELADKLNNAESQRSVLDQTVRQLELQLRELQNRGAIGGGNLGSGISGAGLPGAIQGEIRDVALDPGSNQTLVELNLGSNDGLSEGATLRATRGGSWVANLRATAVDLNRSTAVVTTVRQGGSVFRGDKVKIQ